jgi:hypothetical protein
MRAGSARSRRGRPRGDRARGVGRVRGHGWVIRLCVASWGRHGGSALIGVRPQSSFRSPHSGRGCDAIARAASSVRLCVGRPTGCRWEEADFGPSLTDTPGGSHGHSWLSLSWRATMRWPGTGPLPSLPELTLAPLRLLPVGTIGCQSCRVRRGTSRWRRVGSRRRSAPSTERLIYRQNSSREVTDGRRDSGYAHP